MKKIFLLYFSLSLLTFLYSQANEKSGTEKMEDKKEDINKFKKWEITFGGSNSTNDKNSEKQNNVNLGIYYNISSRISIGYSHFHSKNTGNSILLLPLDTTYIPFAQNKFDISNEIGVLNFRFFLSTTIPFFLKFGIGRDFIGSKYTTTEYGYLTRNRLILSPTVSRQDVAPNNLISASLGYQKTFENGLLLGFEYTRMRSQNAKENVHTEFYSESLPIFLFLNESYSHNIKINHIFVSFWVGYAFWIFKISKIKIVKL